MTTRRYSGPDDLDRMLRERCSSGPDPTDQDAYYDSGRLRDDDDENPPWLDRAPDHEEELWGSP